MFGEFLTAFAPFFTFIGGIFNEALGVFFGMQIFGASIIMFPIAIFFVKYMVTRMLGGDGG